MFDSVEAAPKNLLWGWSLLAILSLAMAGLFAILLVMSKVALFEDALPWPQEFFQKGLIVHVVLSFAVWFLAVLGCFTQTASRSSSPLAKAGLSLAVLGVVLLLVPAALDRGEPTLNNYIPVIIDPLYYAGLVVFAAGVLCAVVNMIFEILRPGEPAIDAAPALLSIGLLYIVALVAMGVALYQLQGVALSHDYNERLFWGGGHVLQFVNVALFLLALARLGAVIGTPSRKALTWAAGLLFLSGAAGLSFFGLVAIDGQGYLDAFSDLQYALGVPVLLFAVLGGVRWRDLASMNNVAALSLAASIIVFTVGGGLGFFVDGADTRTPAHYHGVIGGINLAFVGLFYVYFLPALGRSVGKGKLVFSQIILYAVGQLLFVIGTFMAGSMGAARKVMGAGVEMDSLSALIVSGIRGFGGGLAIIGGLMFIYIALKALLKNSGSPQTT